MSGSRLVALVGLAVLVWASGSGTLEFRLHAQTPPPAGTPGTEAIIEGDLEVLIEDSDRGSRTLYFLLSGNRRIPLRFLTDPPALVTGTRVRVQGRWDKDGMLVVTSIEAVPAPRSTGSRPLPASRARRHELDRAVCGRAAKVLALSRGEVTGGFARTGVTPATAWIEISEEGQTRSDNERVGQAGHDGGFPEPPVISSSAQRTTRSASATACS